MSNSHFEMVGEFHDKFELQRYNVHRGLTKVDHAFFLFRFDLMFEEAGEILRAYRQKNLAGVADGIADLLYVTYGFAHSLNQDIGRPSMYSNNTFSSAVLCAPEVFTEQFAFILNDITRLPRLMAIDRQQEFYHTLIQVLDDCYGLCNHMHIPIDLVFKEVQRANMSKVRSSGDGDARSTRGSKFDVVKPEGFIPPRILEVLNGTV